MSSEETDQRPDDLRELLFGGAPWYEGLREENGDAWGVWRVAKSPEEAYWKYLMCAGAAFARKHGLLDVYRRKFAAIPARSLTISSATREGRGSTDPLWDIANELIVGAYLECVLGWHLLRHEPQGRATRRGDWEFRSPSGRHVFVEVKSLHEPEDAPDGVWCRRVQGARIRSVLKDAYRQLPDENRATLVVLVNRGDLLSLPYGILHGDVFQSLFGEIQVAFPVLPFDRDRMRFGPSLRDTFVQKGKHRRLGVVAGLSIGGLGTPHASLYAIHNPHAHIQHRVPTSDMAPIVQWAFSEQGIGSQFAGISPDEAWQRIERALHRPVD